MPIRVACLLFGLIVAPLYSFVPRSCTWVFWQDLSKSDQLSLHYFPFKLMKRVRPQTTILFTVKLCVWTGDRHCVETCQRGDRGVAVGWIQPPGEKMSGITAFSTQLTPKTDGASEHCSAAPAKTMATACTRQQESCQANQRGGGFAIEVDPWGWLMEDNSLADGGWCWRNQGDPS